VGKARFLEQTFFKKRPPVEFPTIESFHAHYANASSRRQFEECFVINVESEAWRSQRLKPLLSVNSYLPMLHSVMDRAQPCDFEWLGIIIMVRVGFCAAYLARLTLKAAIPDRIAYCPSRFLFLWGSD
jgi:hypothetical protein